MKSNESNTNKKKIIYFKHVDLIYLSIKFKLNTIIKLNYNRKLVSNSMLEVQIWKGYVKLLDIKVNFGLYNLILKIMNC